MAWVRFSGFHGAAGFGTMDEASATDRAVVQFLKRRYASAIRCGDDRTATRLRAELDRLINGPASRSDRPVTPELPPAA
jgi:hypothetical protein